MRFFSWYDDFKNFAASTKNDARKFSAIDSCKNTKNIKTATYPKIS